MIKEVTGEVERCDNIFIMILQYIGNNAVSCGGRRIFMLDTRYPVLPQ